MSTISGTVSGNAHAMVARRTDKEGNIRSEQSISPGSGSFSFSLDEGDEVKILEVKKSDEGVAEPQGISSGGTGA